MKVKVPQEFKIASHTYTIKYDPKQLESTGAMGLCRHLYKEIILSNNLPESEKMENFLHEYLHCVERIWVAKLDDVDVDRIAEGLCVLFNNLGIEFDWSEIKELST